jgi:hypothetical protein
VSVSIPAGIWFAAMSVAGGRVVDGWWSGSAVAATKKRARPLRDEPSWKCGLPYSWGDVSGNGGTSPGKTSPSNGFVGASRSVKSTTRMAVVPA